MTVYVDDMHRRATVGRITATWSHLMADTTEELNAFAKELGLNPAWIQDAGRPTEHYDVVQAKRQQALALGAMPIQYREAGHLSLAKRRGAAFDVMAHRRELRTPA